MAPEEWQVKWAIWLLSRVGEALASRKRNTRFLRSARNDRFGGFYETVNF
jgi:hypothetical protein